MGSNNDFSLPSVLEFIYSPQPRILKKTRSMKTFVGEREAF